MRKDIYTTYAPSADITYIMCDTYEGEEIKSTEVVGWYYGEPDEESTKFYIGKLTATY